MKAFLLVGGLGTRLRPITNTMPKCLVDIAGKPVIDYWVTALLKNGISEILVNLHHFPHLVKDHLQNTFPSARFTFYHEEVLLGSAGTIKANYNYFKEDDAVLVIYGDNFTDLPLGDFIEFSQKSNTGGSIALFTSPNPSACGIVELDKDGLMIDFIEKPAEPRSNLANGGLYIFKNEVFPVFISEESSVNPFDIGFHILPQLIGKLSGWRITDYFIDIGTPENLQKARHYLVTDFPKTKINTI